MLKVATLAATTLACLASADLCRNKGDPCDSACDCCKDGGKEPCCYQGYCQSADTYCKDDASILDDFISHSKEIIAE